MNQNQDQNHVPPPSHNPLVPFSYHSHQVRTIKKPDKSIWFVAKDVCDVLGLTTTARAIQNLDDDEKGVSKVHTLGGEQAVSIINESGLYALILRSNKPEAKTFRKWVTSEVLPAIRQNGAYAPAHVKKPHHRPALPPPQTVPDAIAYGAVNAIRLLEKLARSGKDMAFIRKIARYRNKGLTQHETGILMGLSRYTIREYEALAKACGFFQSAPSKGVGAGFIPARSVSLSNRRAATSPIRAATAKERYRPGRDPVERKETTIIKSEVTHE